MSNLLLAWILGIVLFMGFLLFGEQAMMLRKMRRIAMALEELKSAIEHATSVQAAAVALIRDLAEKIANMSQHPDAEQMRQLAHELRAKADELAGAIAEHAEDDDKDEDPGIAPQPQGSPRRR